MFRKVVSRLGVGAVLVASVAALVAATAGSGGIGFVSAQTFSSVDGNNVACPGFGVNERHYCLDVTTYSNLKKSGGVEVDLALKNYDQSTLTNPSTNLTWTNTGVNLSFLSSNPSICSSPAEGQVTCNFANIPGVGSISGPGVTPITSSVKLFFGAAAIDSVSSVSFKATANAKESGNDSGGAANVETQTVDPAVMTFDGNTGAGANEDATVVLPSAPFNKPHLLAALSNASVDFTSGSAPFIAQFAASNGAACFPGIACTGLQLATDLSGAAGGTFSAANQILWTADVAATNTNVLAVHYYDPVSISASPPSTLTTAGTGFASCDGVNFGNTPPAGLTANQDYFVRNATVSGGSTSFQVSATAKGQALSFTGSGSFSGSCVRIIGDQKSEKIGPCTATTPPAAPAQPPALCGVKLSSTTVRVFLWDSANGKISY
jgi:hypothetical protein